MSRFGNAYDTWDGDGPSPELYNRAALNALRGRRGQAVLHELREALLGLPKPRLIGTAFAKEGEVCALGALARHRFLKGAGFLWGREVMTSLPQLEERLGGALEEDDITLLLGERLGLKEALAWAISYENDEGEWGGETPEERYQRMLRWVEGNLVAGSAG